MRIYIYCSLGPAARARLRQELPGELQVLYHHDLPEKERQAAFQTAEVALGYLPPAWLAGTSLPQLRFWQLDSTGFDRYRHVALAVSVANMGDFFAGPCAETILAGLLALYRQLPQLVQLQAQKTWVGGSFARQHFGLLGGQRVVILGAGAIGQAVHQYLSGFGCAVQFMARTHPAAHLRSVAELRAVLPHTDVVVNCLPGTAAGFFSADLVAAMRTGSFYASVGRGITTDEGALVAALQSGHLGGAVLDVTATEPLPTDSPLWTLPNVLLTQHTGWGHPQHEMGKVDMLLRNLIHLQAGTPLENQIDLGRGY